VPGLTCEIPVVGFGPDLIAILTEALSIDITLHSNRQKATVSCSVLKVLGFVGGACKYPLTRNVCAAFAERSAVTIGASSDKVLDFCDLASTNAIKLAYFIDPDAA
jgi:hypothetical protein